MQVFLDESGALTESDGKYFVVGTFTIGDARRVTKAFRKWQKSKFPRVLKNQTEVKFNDAHLDDNHKIENT